ncbi:hypothetical protein GIB67_032272 [Kingdonia uniflora]|uniref:CCHC-type domain-containing protein n=1 Tax=Kingdonia uniflora TaxID=39325 RepID=A0A7J7MX25_9MAGN|nr:hypothetical protein GIB67_032272 [Kingdonia uniflora]
MTYFLVATLDAKTSKCSPTDDGTGARFDTLLKIFPCARSSSSFFSNSLPRDGTTKNLIIHLGGTWQDPWERIVYTYDLYVGRKQHKFDNVDGDRLSLICLTEYIINALRTLNRDTPLEHDEQEYDLSSNNLIDDDTSKDDTSEDDISGDYMTRDDTSGHTIFNIESKENSEDSDSEYNEWLTGSGHQTKDIGVDNTNEVVDWTRLAELCPYNLDAEEGYYNTYSSLEDDGTPTQNAWTICRERIVGSYDEGYIIMLELTVQVLLENPGSILTCSIDLMTNEWTGTCITYKGSMEGLLNGYRPQLGLDGCFLKGKYGGVCFSTIGMDGNNGLFPIAVFFCRSEFCLLIPMRHPWIEYCSEYHTVAKYVSTYNLPIHAIDDPSEWGQGYTVLPPTLVRGPSRTKKKRIKDQDEVLGNYRRCGKCGVLGHMKKTCKGPSAQPSGTSTRQRNRLDTNSCRVEHRRNVGASSQIPVVRGRERGNSSRGGRGSANSNNESRTSTNIGRGNGKKMGRATATRVRGTAAKTGINATANTGRGTTSNTGRGAASNIGRGAASNIGKGAVTNNGRAPFQPPRPDPYIATQSSQTTSVTNPYKKAYQTPTRNWKPLSLTFLW